jgi:hypothetical protein
MKKITPRKNIDLFRKGVKKINKSMKAKGFGCNTCICNMIEPYPKELLIILDKYNWKFREFTGCAKRAYALDEFFGLSGAFTKHCTTGLNCDFARHILLDDKAISFRTVKI